jgi:antitoxin VapB
MPVTARAKVFKSGNSLAIRLPRSFGLTEGAEFDVTSSGREIILRPDQPTFQGLVEALMALPAPEQVEVRDTEEIPERPGL